MRLTDDIRTHAFKLAKRADVHNLSGDRDLARACVAASAALFDAAAQVDRIEALERGACGRMAA